MTHRPAPRFRSRLVGAGLCLLLAAGWLGCGSSSDPTSYEVEVLRERFEKDMAFSNAETTILRPSEREGFAGLRYYPVDTTYRFVLPLLPADTIETILIAQRTPPPMPYLKVGHVEVPFPEGAERLAVFRAHTDPKDRLWIPFVDATSGLETYGGGRYLDPEILDDGRLLVDFNRAYNPYCDYNPSYNCAIPPPENRLSAAVRAGEQASQLLAHE